MSVRILTILLLLMVATGSLAEDPWVGPAGQYVLLDDFRIYFHCRGEGQPTVVIDTGIGDASANWLTVQEGLSGSVKTCIYDRAGYGMSDAGPGPRVTSQITTELYLLLKKANITGPYVLVGHSFGGFTAQYFASHFPDETLGLVLVESSHPAQVKRLAELDTMKGAKKKSVGGYQALDEDKLTPEQKYWKLLNSTRKSVYAQMQELRYFKDSAREVHKIEGIPEIPVVVISRGIEQLPKIEGKYSLEGIWQEMQLQLTELSPHSWRVIVKESGHSVHLEAPDVVIEQTLKVIEKTRQDLAWNTDS